MIPLVPPAFLASLGGPEFLFFGFALFIALPCFLFWLWMLIDCLVREPDPTQKLVWVIVIIFVSIIGAPLYFFIRFLPRRSTPHRPRRVHHRRRDPRRDHPQG